MSTNNKPEAPKTAQNNAAPSKQPPAQKITPKQEVIAKTMQLAAEMSAKAGNNTDTPEFEEGMKHYEAELQRMTEVQIREVLANLEKEKNLTQKPLQEATQKQDDIIASETSDQKVLEILKAQEAAEAAKIAETFKLAGAEEPIKKLKVGNGQVAYFDRKFNKQFVDSAEQVDLIIKYGKGRFIKV